ncbi:hypothetical protein DXG03_004436 [Asterophora parasitica]|uniref:Transmembrane protein n=1 Tax=Asterophora parasitica TaxID=117018 RepID=A0A9P7G2P0_9AGAR|nr:hypothetical protein DXG03_004436 [Asterophora parasitica]
MPSFRTLFFLAATAFVTLTSGAPVDSGAAAGQVGNVVPIGGAASGTMQDINTKNNEVNMVDKRADFSDADLLLTEVSAVVDVDFLKRHNGELHSLCEVLVDVEAKLNVVSSKLVALVDAKVAVEVEVVVGIVAEVKAILAGAVVEVKAIVGHPINFILSLGGKVLAIADVCHLLLAVLSVICGIFTCVLRIVGVASINVVLPLTAAVGVILAELLCVIFTLVDGLYIAIHPFLGPVIQICVVLKLDVLVAVLNGKY